MNLPDIFKTRMKLLLQDEYDDFIESYSHKPNYGIRSNLLKIKNTGLAKLLPFTPEKVPWCPEGFYCPESFRPGKSPLYHAGLFYIQEPSAMSTVSVFDIKPGHKVLDLCAAPGGKSSHAAGKLQGQGLLVSNDVSASRTKALVKNIELTGASNAVVLSETPEKLAHRFENFFDRIIVDAPCSGEGMFRKDQDALKSWAVHKSQLCSGLQREILYHAAKMLKHGGKIMYSTCTFAPEENELIVTEFLNKNLDFKPCAIDFSAWGISSGLNTDGNSAIGCGRIWPHKQRGEGHFLACLEKNSNSTALSSPYTEKQSVIKDIGYYFEFCDKYLNFTPGENYVLFGEALYSQPKELPPLEGIRVARSGLYLGDIKAKRFEPSQALAMSLKRGDARNITDFSDKAPELIRYLKGESIESDAPDGWNLICCLGYPVGWGKVMGSRVKNKYSRSWLMN